MSPEDAETRLNEAGLRTCRFLCDGKLRIQGGDILEEVGGIHGFKGRVFVISEQGNAFEVVLASENHVRPDVVGALTLEDAVNIVLQRPRGKQ